MFFDNLKIDNRPKFLGWAPGDYIGQCNKCGEQYQGHKRAVTCADCAYSHIPEGYAMIAVARGGRMKIYPVEMAGETCEGDAAFTLKTFDSESAELEVKCLLTKSNIDELLADIKRAFDMLELE